MRRDDKPDLVTVPLSAMVIDPEVQPRADGLHKPTVEEYRERHREGDEFPPLVAYGTKKKAFLSEGFHRAEMYRLEEVAEVVVELRDGDRDAAMVNACASNRGHGRQRTNKDKREAVSRMLTLRPEWSDRRIAAHVGVSNEMVGDVRKSQVSDSDTCQSPKRVGKDGKEYALPPPARPATSKPKPPIEPTDSIDTKQADDSSSCEHEAATRKVAPATPDVATEPSGQTRTQQSPASTSHNANEGTPTPDGYRFHPERPTKPKPKDRWPAACAITANTKYFPTVVVLPGGGEGVFDAYGTVAPAKVGDYFNDSAFREIHDEAERIAGEMADVFTRLSRMKGKIDKSYPWAKHGDLMTQAEKMANAAAEFLEIVADALPFVVCPRCHGAACKDCRHTGYWPASECNAHAGELPKTPKPIVA